MASTVVSVGSTVGLHARPASIIADAANKYDDPIILHLVGEDDEGADATSTLMIMALGAEFGDEVEIVTDNPVALKEIAQLIKANLDDGNR